MSNDVLPVTRRVAFNKNSFEQPFVLVQWYTVQQNTKI